MNKFSNIVMTLLVLSGIFFLTACIKGDFDTPPTPKVDFAANTSITQLVAMHTPGGLDDITTDVIVKGVVIANDKSGIIYKAIFIEDDSAGIQIPIDQKNMFNTFAIGQTVYVKCKGLALGEDAGTYQLGYNLEGTISSIPSSLFSSHIFLDGWPETAPAPVVLNSSNFANVRNMNRLVKFENISFPDANQVFCSLGSTFADHQIGTIPLTSLALYVSPYASYALDTIPSGTGSVTGILVKYNTMYELMIRDLNDLDGFNSK